MGFITPLLYKKEGIVIEPLQKRERNRTVICHVTGEVGTNTTFYKPPNQFYFFKDKETYRAYEKERRYRQRCYLLVTRLLNYKLDKFIHFGKHCEEVLPDYDELDQTEGKKPLSRTVISKLKKLSESAKWEEIYYSLASSVEEIQDGLNNKHFPNEQSKARWVIEVAEDNLKSAKKELAKLKKLKKLRKLREERLEDK